MVGFPRLGSSQASWSSGRRDGTPPLTCQLCNGSILVGPPYSWLAVRQTNLRHNFMGLVIALPPIPTRLCGSGRAPWRVVTSHGSRSSMLISIEAFGGDESGGAWESRREGILQGAFGTRNRIDVGGCGEICAFRGTMTEVLLVKWTSG